MATISVGTVSVSVIPDVKRFASSANAKLIPEARKLGDAMGKIMADRINAQLARVRDVRIGVDDKAASAELDVFTRDRHTTVTVDVDKSSVSRIKSVLGGLSGVFGKGVSYAVIGRGALER